jgi:hypothetical protein
MAEREKVNNFGIESMASARDESPTIDSSKLGSDMWVTVNSLLYKVGLLVN